MKTLINLSPDTTKSETLEMYNGVEYLEVLNIWGDRSYHWIGANGHQNGANSIVVFRHCVDTEPNTPKQTKDNMETEQFTPINAIVCICAIMAIISIIIWWL